MTLRELALKLERRFWPEHLVRRQLREWPLLERMERASAPGPSSPSPHWLKPRDGKQRPVRRIQEQDFTVSTVRAELNALAQTGGDLLLPAGRLELAEGLSLPSGVRLAGVAGRTEMIFRGVAYGISLCGSPDEPMRDAGLEHIRIRHELPPPGFAAAVRLVCAREIHLRRVEVLAPQGIGFLLADRVINAFLEGCTVCDGDRDGFLFIRDVSDCVLLCCAAKRCFQSGVLFADWKLPPDVDRLDFEAQVRHPAQCVAFAAGDPGPCRITLSDCVFTGNRRMGVCTDGGGYLRIVNCTIADNQCEGITLDNGTWCCHVANCRIRGNGRRGIQSEVELSEDLVKRDGLLADGTSPVKLPGVSMDNAAFCRVEHCLIEGNYGEGVKFVRAGYGCTVAHNTIANNNRGGSPGHPHFGVRIGADRSQHPGQFDFPSSANRVVDNDILGDHEAGVLLNEGTTRNLVSGNRIVGALRAAVDDRSGCGTNTIRDNGPDRPVRF